MDDKFLKMVSGPDNEFSNLSKDDGELALRLMRAYFAIADIAKRKQIVELAEKFAKTSVSPKRTS